MMNLKRLFGVDRLNVLESFFRNSGEMYGLITVRICLKFLFR